MSLFEDIRARSLGLGYYGAPFVESDESLRKRLAYVGGKPYDWLIGDKLDEEAERLGLKRRGST